MDGLKERAVAEGIVREEDWPKIIQHGCTHFLKGIFRLLDLHRSNPELFSSDMSPEEESTEFTNRIINAKERLELEDVDKVRPGKDFMPFPEIHINIPKVIIPILNKIISDANYKLPPK